MANVNVLKDVNERTDFLLSCYLVMHTDNSRPRLNVGYY
jgi:hypothetical protein